MQTLIITRPDDWHVHLRDNEMLQHTVPDSAQHFARALIMPNLKPALTTLRSLDEYRNRILQALPEGNAFEPYMTFYLNDSVHAEELHLAAAIPYILGAKLYPAGATTNSEAGAKSLKDLYPLLEVMQNNNLVLQIHGEVTHSDIFERESLFIDEYLKPIVTNFPKLRIVLEHISTQAAVDYVTEAPATVTATITPHHLLYNRNKLLAGGLRPHYYCLPVLKHENDQKALQHAACSGNPKFFAGTDSAPHSVSAKESACGCAGIYSAPFALALYAQVFDEMGQLKQLNDFLSRFGAEFYQLPINEQRLELIKSPQTIPDFLPFGSSQVVPIAAGETIQWSVHELT
ncbi:dihydroorotase [Fluoribacter dumoffii]|uniref:dihydroorotase n=1 Tax=Fluoribacter dumoffii TaxID=463 RepID=UPI00026C7A91|nr:dihydroorotase [Fluoribacter dumoffii]MCW8417143.1 dihydroorotase [Fluoribacter dumoffii]MCW8455017.1 dihydroorotase [Fluoribacter dumoffii]MCW8460906.1 dihydroorotase [Fluoribacter dumoffii]MCW8484348.1 dihydroorotase [Fluoribacter dumoffii]